MIKRTILFNNINYSKKKLIKIIKYLNKNKELLPKIINNNININIKSINIIKNILNKVINNNIINNNNIKKIIINRISINKYKTHKKLVFLAKGRNSIIKKNKSSIKINITYK